MSETGLSYLVWSTSTEEVKVTKTLLGFEGFDKMQFKKQITYPTFMDSNLCQGLGKITQWLRMLAALAEDLSWFPESMFVLPLPIISPCLVHLRPSSSFQVHLNIDGKTCTEAHGYMHK